MTPHDGQLEQLISELADGSLPAADRARVEALVQSDPALARLLTGYRRLASKLAVWRIPPADIASADWRRDTRRRIEDDLTATMSAYADGALPAETARRVAERFAADAAAARIRGQLDRTDELLASWARPMPAVDWNATKARFSSAIRQDVARRRRRTFARWAGGIALAASLALAAFLTLRGNRPNVAPANPAVEPVQVVLEKPNESGQAVAKFDERPPPEEKSLTPPANPSRVTFIPSPRPRPPVNEDNTPNF